MCPNLVSLYVDIGVSTSEHDITDSTGISSWFANCKSLQHLDLEDCRLDSSVFINVLLDKGIPLKTLRLYESRIRLSRNFFRALATKVSLTDLELSIFHPKSDEVEDTCIVECLLCLTSLENLSIQMIIYFDDQHIKSLARRLTGLKRVILECQEITDKTWDSLSNLTNLRSLELRGSPEFRLDGFLSYVFKLGPGNSNLVITVVATSPSPMPLTCDEEARAMKAMNEKVNGSIYYERGYDSEDYSDG